MGAVSTMALIFPQDQFQHILRVLNTNVDGRHKVPFAITSIKGVGRRFANMVCKKAEINLNKRAGELTSEEIDKIVAVIQNPLTFMPSWFVNRKKDVKDGRDRQDRGCDPEPTHIHAILVRQQEEGRQRWENIPRVCQSSGCQDA